MTKPYPNSKPLPPSEFSRPIAVTRLEPGELTETISAREEELKALAARFGLVALESLSAVVTLRRVGRGPVVEVEGRLVGEAVQSCIVTLEPLTNRVEESFLLTFAPARQVRPLQDLPGGDAAPKRGAKPNARRAAEAEEPDLEAQALAFGEEPPEPLIGGMIDIGEAVAQQFALALDPYPRKPQAKLEDVIGAREGVSVGVKETGVGRPFAALERLARRKP